MNLILYKYLKLSTLESLLSVKCSPCFSIFDVSQTLLATKLRSEFSKYKFKKRMLLRKVN